VPSLCFIYGRLGDLQITAYLSGTASVYFDDVDNATCKSRVGLPYSVLPGRLVAERTIFGFGCERTIGSWIQACNTTMQYAFVLHCCDVMALYTVSQISNKSTDMIVGFWLTWLVKTRLQVTCFINYINCLENSLVLVWRWSVGLGLVLLNVSWYMHMRWRCRIVWSLF